MPLNPLSLYAEPYGSTGNIGENFRRLLGAPALDPLQTVVRESVQNISDAAKLGRGPEIVIRIRNLTDAQRTVLAETVFAELPSDDQSRTRLNEFTRKPNATVMEICDFGTTGLGGPTRADQIPIGETRTDFIDFVRNVGTPRDTEHGGGTYGFGKVALYRASRCSTILIDTQPSDGSAAVRRLIGSHVGRSFERRSDGMRRRFTGRYWWGISDPEDDIVDPVTCDAAAEIASALGFLPRDQDRTGTSIMILDLDTDDEDLERLGWKVTEALLWNFWPRMMRSTPDERRFHCTIEVNGNHLEIPSPEEYPPLDLFSKAMQAARDGQGNDLRTIRSMRPAAKLGQLAVERGLRGSRRKMVPQEESVFPERAHHIALMRPVELVVRYLEGNALPDERFEWAGVFVTNNEYEVEQAFADSEPPAHDDWIPNNLPKGHSKTYVNVALRELRSAAAEMGEVAAGYETLDRTGPPLARVAGKLGVAIEGIGGEGAGQPRRGSTGSRRQPSRARASRPEFVRLEQDGNHIIAIFSTEVRQDSAKSGSELMAKAAVSVDGVTLDNNTSGDGANPTVLSIRSIEQGLSTDSDSIALEGAEGAFEIRVSMPPDCAVTVEARVIGGAES